jgi:hypothetical protein
MGDTFDRAIDLKTSKNSVQDDEATLRSTAFVDMLSKTLLMHNFLKQPSVLKSAVIDFEKYVPVYLDSFKRVVDRKTGMGMKISKFHFPTHHADDIKRFGPATSWDSSTGESNHIGLKGAARNTQKNTKKFEVQTAQRYHENHVIATAHSLLKAPSTETQCDVDILQTKSVSHLIGKSYYISDGYLFNSIGRMVNWRDSDMQKRVLNLVRDVITPNVKAGSKIWLYTRYQTEQNNTLFRAHPGYDQGESHWHDWANIEWEPKKNNKKSTIPARLSIFFRIESWIPGRRSNTPWFQITSNGDYAIASSLIESIYTGPTTNVVALTHNRIKTDTENYLAHQGSELIYWSCLETSIELPHSELSRIIPVCAIVGSCIAVPFDLTEASDGIEWLIIPSINTWNGIFAREMKSKTKKD